MALKRAPQRATASLGGGLAERRAGDPDARAPMSTLRWRRRMAHAEGRPRAGRVWVVAVSSPHVQSHGKCVCMM